MIDLHLTPPPSAWPPSFTAFHAARRRRWIAAIAPIMSIGILLIGLGLCHASFAQSNIKEQSNGQHLIIQAKAAFAQGRLAEVERISARLQHDPLAVWADYWRLKLLIGSPGATPGVIENQVQAFLQRHPGHPLAESAQRDWVIALIQKELWDQAALALQQIPPSLDGPQMACARATFGVWKPNQKLADHPAQAAVLAIGNESAQACLALITALAKDRHVDHGYLLTRARWAAQTGSESAYKQLLDLALVQAKDNATLITAAPQTVAALRSEVLLGQVLNRSRTNNLSALQLFERHQQELTPEQRSYGSLAVGAALWRRSHGNAWAMMQAGWESLPHQPDDVLQIIARESLKHGEWKKLLEVIDHMSAPLQQQPTWRYWQAMALNATRPSLKAWSMLRELRNDYSFYGLLARESLGESIVLPAPAAVTLNEQRRQALNQHPGMQRSYALLRLGLRAEAITEWSAAMKPKNDTELIQAALHAQETGFPDRMIAAADRTQSMHNFSLRYPAAFKESVIPVAQEKALDPWWVLGLIRQESRFIPDIRSSAGATGLMQIMPATGKMLARDVGLRPAGRLQLTDVDTNIHLGTTYMRQLRDRFNGSALLASAAYNAGPSRAITWRAALSKKIDGAAFAESIPFDETRDYVKRVLTNAVLYHAVHTGGPAPSLKSMLGEIVPASPL
jgi:soluble lytic murein transglycosylase